MLFGLTYQKSFGQINLTCPFRTNTPRGSIKRANKRMKYSNIHSLHIKWKGKNVILLLYAINQKRFEFNDASYIKLGHSPHKDPGSPDPLSRESNLPTNPYTHFLDHEWTKACPKTGDDRHTDRQTTGWFQYIPPLNFLCGGINFVWTQ